MSDVIKVLSVGDSEWRDLTPGGIAAEGRSVVVWLESAELTRLLAAYDPNSGTSPSVADARPVLREILDAVIAGQAG
jgi:hypothetical protein